MSSDALGNGHLEVRQRQARRLRIAAWVSLPILACAYFGLLVSTLPPLTKLVVLECIYCTPIVLTVVWGLKARSLSEGNERLFWGSLSLANALLFACELLLVWWVVVVSPSGPPRVSWPFHILHAFAAGSFIVAIMSLSRFSVGSVATRWRWAIDMAAVALVGGVWLLELYVHPVMAPAGATVAETLLGVGYPLFAAVMIGGTLGIVVGFKVDRWRSWDRLFAVSLIIYALATMLWPVWFTTASETSRNYQRGVLDLVQFAGHWLLMAAAVYRLTEVEDWQLRPLPPLDAARRRWASAVVPAVLFVGVPMIGYLAYRDTASGQFFVFYVVAFTLLTGLTLARSTLIALENGALFSRSISDPLTGLHNHRFFHDRLEEELVFGRRYGEPVSLVLIDLDDFAEVNAQWGYLEGERLLQEVAGLLRGRCGEDCVVARLGGDDFGIIAPNTSPMDATILARSIIDQISIAAGSEPGALTACAGVATAPDHASEADDLLRLAQHALTTAKRSGSERVVAYEAGAVRSHGLVRAEEADDAPQHGAAQALMSALQSRDSRAAAHAIDVAELALRVSLALNLDDATTWRIQWGARLHGVGLLAHDAPWRGPGQRDAAAAAVDRESALAILSSAGLTSLVPAIRAIDERWDGRGNPERLLQEEIPVEARVIAAAHGYVGRRGAIASPEADRDALDWLVGRSGVDYDPVVVDALARLIEIPRG